MNRKKSIDSDHYKCYDEADQDDKDDEDDDDDEDNAGLSDRSHLPPLVCCVPATARLDEAQNIIFCEIFSMCLNIEHHFCDTALCHPRPDWTRPKI